MVVWCDHNLEWNIPNKRGGNYVRNSDSRNNVRLAWRDWLESFYSGDTQINGCAKHFLRLIQPKIEWGPHIRNTFEVFPCRAKLYGMFLYKFWSHDPTVFTCKLSCFAFLLGLQKCCRCLQKLLTPFKPTRFIWIAFDVSAAITCPLVTCSTCCIKPCIARNAWSAAGVLRDTTVVKTNREHGN